MIRPFTLASLLVSVLTVSAMAADTTTKTDISAAPATTTAATLVTDSIVMTEQEGANWVNKPVYSSDGTNLGHVVDFQRGADAKVIGMHADIGGFLGMLQTRINVLAPQFKLQGDRIVLTLTSAEAKALPAIKT